MIEICDVRKSFRDLTVLKGISLKIEDHEIYGIVGQSGAGRSEERRVGKECAA